MYNVGTSTDPEQRVHPAARTSRTPTPERARQHHASPPDTSPESLRSSRVVLDDLFGPSAERTFAVRFWDGTVDTPRETPRFTLVLQQPGALRRMLLPPSELSLTEAYIFGDVDLEGDLESAAALGDVAAGRIASLGALLRLERHAAALPRDHAPATHQAHQARGLLRAGRRHSVRRDRQAVRFHYDVGNRFYQLWLDRNMVYSCGYFERGDEDIDTAQRAKLDHICRKLRLKAGERLLDIGCGWGGLIRHAVRRYGVIALGITLSENQAHLARERIAADGLGDRCRVEVRDYRDLAGEPAFDKIASVGMVEHVGAERLGEYFAAAFRALRAGGLFLNHGIINIADARPQSTRDRIAGKLWRRGAFIDRYVFPDGALVPAALVIACAEEAGFELRDVESLREHYATTLRHWVRRLEASEPDAVALVGEPTYRVWRLYMAASAYGFRTGRIGIIQSLLAKQDSDGRASVPRTRRDLYVL